MKIEIYFEDGSVKYIDLTEMERKRGKAKVATLIDSSCEEMGDELRRIREKIERGEDNQGRQV